MRPSRHADDFRATDRWRRGPASDPRRLPQPPPGGISQASLARPLREPRRRGCRYCAPHRPSRRLVADFDTDRRRCPARGRRLARYLANHPRIGEPADLAKHQIVAFTNFGLDSWTFTPAEGSLIPRTVQFTPRCIVNSVRAALDFAAAGTGLTRLYSYHVARYVSDGRLKIVLADAEHPPMPVHLLAPQGRMSVPKVRAFTDFALPRLRTEFSRMATEAGKLG